MTASPGWRVVALVLGGIAGWTAWILCARLTRAHPRWARTNFRGRDVSVAGGLAAATALVVGAAAVGFAAPLFRGETEHDVRRIAFAVALVGLGAGAVGLVDDLFGDPAAKGFRGHLRALRQGRCSTGLVKLVVIGLASLAAAVLLGSGDVGPQQLVDAGVIAGSANLANLLDLRPGRALKVLLCVGVPVVVLAGPAVALVAAWPVGVAVGLLAPDLGERAMLGDGGANALGGAVGVALAASGGFVVSALLLAGLVVVTAVSEVVSFSTLIERSPPLRWADQLGRTR